jgi:hypothetical protein
MKKYKYNTEDYVNKAREIRGDFYDYSKVDYINSHTKICIIDPEYGEFWMTPNAHLCGQGHPIRGKLLAASKRSMGKEGFIKRAREKFGDLYDYSKVEYINCDEKVLIIDPEYGEFWQTPFQHLNSYGNSMRTLKRKAQTNVDHIVPISLICSRRKNNNNWFKQRPLYIFLDSDLNKREIPTIENKKKSDFIEIGGRKVSGESIRNNYEIIYKLVLEKLGLDIAEIIEEDKKFIKGFFKM